MMKAINLLYMQVHNEDRSKDPDEYGEKGLLVGE